MVTGISTSFERVDDALRQVGAEGRASEAHGSLCGLACLLGPGAGSVWVAGLLGPVPAADPADEDVLGLVARATCTALTEGDMSFAPLLPPDDRPLSLRTEGLAEWCAGFMHGLGEAAGHAAARDALTGELAQEIMQDFGEIARLTLDEDEADAEAESAYTELVEFVRVSVQMMFEELHDVRRRLAAVSVH